MNNRYFSVVFWIILTLSAGIIGGWAGRPGDWYFALAKPSWMPPDWVFAPVWLLLYVMMGIAIWLIWQRRHLRSVRPAVVLYMGQLILNAAWSWFFFGWQNPGLALADICLLWMAILATLIVFWRIRRLAAWLFLPYFLWVTFAAALNFSIWRLNMGGFA